MRKHFLLALLLGGFGSASMAAEPLIISARSRQQVDKAVTINVNGRFVTRVIPETVVVESVHKINPAETAIIICDMWDNHWCVSAAKRCDVLAKDAGKVVESARKQGFTIIHCPSDTMDFYKETGARKRTLALKSFDLPKNKEVPNEPLPIDDSDGGCDDGTPTKQFRAWKRQHEAISIDDDRDFITDQGKDVWNILQTKKLKTVIVMGVHTNMCVLNRTFAIKQMKKWDVPCFLCRDLTDAMYNPRMKPFVTHEAGTNLVIEQIERIWCPTIESKELMAK